MHLLSQWLKTGRRRYRLLLPVIVYLGLAILPAAASAIGVASVLPETGKPDKQQRQFARLLSRLRENSQKISNWVQLIEYAHKMHPAPAVSSSGQKAIASAETEYKHHCARKHCSRAAGALRQAIETAPWISRLYFEFGAAEVMAGNYRLASPFLTVYYRVHFALHPRLPNAYRPHAIQRIHPPATQAGKYPGCEVQLRTTIGVDGLAHKISIAHSKCSQWQNQKAMQALHDWLFKPARMANRPVSETVVISVISRFY